MKNKDLLPLFIDQRTENLSLNAESLINLITHTHTQTHTHKIL